MTEMLAEKIVYHGAEAGASDLFDFAAAARAMPDALDVPGGRMAVMRSRGCVSGLGAWC